jgi:glucose-6-phosphate 1-dehydrogenase
MPEPHSDAVVLFGATGDLAYEQIFPALQAMTRGHLDIPVIGVAKPDWTVQQMRVRTPDLRHYQQDMELLEGDDHDDSQQLLR